MFCSCQFESPFVLVRPPRLIRAGGGRPRWFAVSSPSSYWAVFGPSTRNDAPVMKDALSDERNTNGLGNLFGRPYRA